MTKKKEIRNCGVCKNDILVKEFDEHKSECWSNVVLKNREGSKNESN